MWGAPAAPAWAALITQGLLFEFTLAAPQTRNCTHGLGNSCVGFNPDNMNEISMVDRLIIQSFNTFCSLNEEVGLCCVAQTSLSERSDQ